MTSEVETLQALNFHDSCLRDVTLSFSSGNARKCSLSIDYYNWEANTDGKPWRWRQLVITFGSVAYLEFTSPDVLNRAQDIHDIDFTDDFERFRPAHDKTLIECPKYRSPLFDTDQGPIAMKLQTQNSDWLGTGGHLLVIGSNVQLEWDDDDVLEGQTHIPIAPD